MAEIICNVCRQPITEPVEQVDRKYLVKATGRELPAQKKHDACNASYAAEKTGLQKLAIFLVASLILAVAGCAPYGPWPFSTESQREELLLREGMTVSEVTAKKGNPVAGPLHNPAAAGYRKLLPPKDFTGTAFYEVRGSSSMEEVAFVGGKIGAIRYVRSPWAGYDTWQLHNDTWDKE